MKKIFLLTFLFINLNLFSDFKDFSYKPLREKIKYKEDFFRLYNVWLYKDLDSISRNIYFLELAYVVNFDHPIRALIPITNEIQYERYKNILMMYITLMLTKEYIDYAYMYVKENIYFYNKEFFKDYFDGYDIAEHYLNCALKYWEEAVDFARIADSIKGYRTELHYMEDQLYRIKINDLNYERIINNLMSRINKNREKIKNFQNK